MRNHSKYKMRELQPAVDSAQIGGGGGSSGDAVGSSPPTPATAAAPGSLQQPVAAAAMWRIAQDVPQMAAISSYMLPVGSKQLEASPALQRLYVLYSELQAAEAALSLTSQYLPKLANSGQYVSDSIRARVLALRAEIAALANPKEQQWPNSLPLPAKR